MKKLKRIPSLVIDKMPTKLPQNSKKDKDNKPKLRQKKINIQLVQKQNIKIDQWTQKEKYFKPIVKKNAVEKKTKQRSKSMLEVKKSARKLDELIKNKVNGTCNQFNRRNEAKQQSETLDPRDSFRYQQAASKDRILNPFRQYSEFCKQRQVLTQCQKVKFQDQEIQCTGFSLEQTLNQSQYFNEAQKMEYLRKIEALEKEICKIESQKQKKILQLQISQQKESNLLKCQIQALQKRNMQLIQQKHTLQITVDAQKSQITSQHQTNQFLEQKLSFEEKIKTELRKTNEQSQNRIKNLEIQLFAFQENLNGFQKMKESYETRLQSLEIDKKRIKGNALQLLQILQKIKYNEQND